MDHLKAMDVVGFTAREAIGLGAEAGDISSTTRTAISRILHAAGRQIETAKPAKGRDEQQRSDQANQQ
jgi:hypothetical protein